MSGISSATFKSYVPMEEDLIKNSSMEPVNAQQNTKGVPCAPSKSQGKKGITRKSSSAFRKCAFTKTVSFKLPAGTLSRNVPDKEQKLFHKFIEEAQQTSLVESISSTAPSTLFIGPSISDEINGGLAALFAKSSAS